MIPLYIGYDNDGKVMVASELKALEGQCDHYEPFLPGHYYYSKTPGMKRYYTRDWFEYASMQRNTTSTTARKLPNSWQRLHHRSRLPSNRYTTHSRLR